MQSIEDKIAEIEKQIQENAADYQKLAELSASKDSLEEELINKMERWEYLTDLAEKISRQ